MNAQQLKNSILQMAVSGKLVPQNPNDEPASVLLERIRKEKEKLIKEGKIKKEKTPSYIFRGADNKKGRSKKRRPLLTSSVVPIIRPMRRWGRMSRSASLMMFRSIFQIVGNGADLALFSITILGKL